jgi:hypothetical protein
MKITYQPPAPPVVPPKFDEQLRAYLRDGYEVVSDGPSGVQLRGPKKMRRQTKVAMILGAVLTLAYGIGLVLLLFAMIDHAMAKPPTVFLPR